MSSIVDQVTQTAAVPFFDAGRFTRADRRLAVRGAGLTRHRDLERIKTLHPDRFTDKHAQTVQSAVKRWRAEQACRIIAESAVTIGGVVVRPAA